MNNKINSETFSPVLNFLFESEDFETILLLRKTSVVFREVINSFFEEKASQLLEDIKEISEKPYTRIPKELIAVFITNIEALPAGQKTIFTYYQVADFRLRLKPY